MKLEEAILKLDHQNDDHWTDDGMPRVDVLKEMTGDANLSRKQITDAAPNLKRGEAPDEPEDEAPDEEEAQEEPSGGVVSSEEWSKKLEAMNSEIASLEEQRSEAVSLRDESIKDIALLDQKIHNLEHKIKLGNEPPLNEAEARRAFMKRSGRSQANRIPHNPIQGAGYPQAKPRVPAHLTDRVKKTE